MADQTLPELPKIALVYGDDECVRHVRDVLAAHADIAYAAPVDACDIDALLNAGVTATLVNLDDADALENIEARLGALGVPVVFNDPDVSRRLEGWDRARWLRHLVAKLRGSGDFDPPRPAQDLAVVPDVRPSDSLDVDTAALSAMIDARLADPEVPTNAAGTWSIAQPASADPVESAPGPKRDDRDAANGGDPGRDVGDAFPGLDDWQLVEADVQPAPVTAAHPPAMSLESMPDLELVPIDIGPVAVAASDAVERWLHQPVDKPGAGGNGAKP